MTRDEIPFAKVFDPPTIARARLGLAPTTVSKLGGMALLVWVSRGAKEQAIKQTGAGKCREAVFVQPALSRAPRAIPQDVQQATGKRVEAHKIIADVKAAARELTPQALETLQTNYEPDYALASASFSRR